MSQLITKKDLQGMINRLNRVTGSPDTYSDKQADGKFKSNIGHYHLDFAYGGAKLVRTVNESGGITCPISMGYETKKDAYYMIHAFISGVESTQEVEA
jgi:hypothetical protein